MFNLKFLIVIIGKRNGYSAVPLLKLSQKSASALQCS